MSERSGRAAGVESPLVELDDAAADAVIESLAPERARELVAACDERPRTVSDLVDVLDADAETVREHLTELSAAGVLETVGARDGADLYAPADAGLVVADERDDQAGGFLVRLAGALAGLVVGGVVVGLLSSEPALGAVTFVCGGVVVLGGLVLVDRLLG